MKNIEDKIRESFCKITSDQMDEFMDRSRLDLDERGIVMQTADLEFKVEKIYFLDTKISMSLSFKKSLSEVLKELEKFIVLKNFM